MLPTIDIIIVNWNSGQLLYDCVISITRSVDDTFILDRVVIVDNNSIDESISKIENIDLPITIIKNNTNVGFAKACNQGAENSTADYLLFLNPDTQLFSTSISSPLKFMGNDRNKNVGILGVKIINEDGVIGKNCARFPTTYSLIIKSLGFDKLFPKIFPSHFMIEWDHQDSRIVDQVMGSFFLIRRHLFKRVGGYDERFFVYYEDLDLALRIKKEGFFSYYFAEAEIYHKGGGVTENIKATRLFYNLESKLKFVRKHFNFAPFSIIFFFTVFVEPFSRFIGSIISGSVGSISEIYYGYKILYKSVFINNSLRVKE